jgi:hypothetical protein
LIDIQVVGGDDLDVLGVEDPDCSNSTEGHVPATQMAVRSAQKGERSDPETPHLRI